MRGFTLIEILVALAIGIVLLTALAIVFSRHSGNQSELERATRQMENARFAMDLIAEDIMHAGYFGEFNPNTLPAAPTYVTPTPCPMSLADLGWITPAILAPPTLPTAVQGIGVAAVHGCLENRAAGTEAIVVRHADTGTAVNLAAAFASPGNLFVQVSRCGEDDRRIAVGNTAAELTLRMPACAAVVNDRARRLVQRTYFVAACNDCTGGDGIPTLKRAEWIDGAVRVVALAEGIENLRLEYGVDADGDGVPDNFVGTAGVAQWQDVVAVRVHLLARATQATPGHVEVRTYALPGLDYTPGDAFRRTLLSSTVRLMNVGGRRD